MGADALVGERLAGYLLVSVLGRGGMGVVYLAEDERLCRHVAVKVLAPELAEDDEYRERFLRESRVAAALEHPHVIPIHEAGEVDGTVFLAMRYVAGSDLKAVLLQDGRLSPQRALVLISQVGSALDAAHASGLVHRDVKPGNLLVASGMGDADHAYLCDFGLAKQTRSRDSVSAATSMAGTLEYMAPEQIQGEAIDGRVDVYALGCVLYQLLTGTPPYQGTDAAVLWAHIEQAPPRASERRRELPAQVDGVIQRAMAKQPEDRYTTGGEMADALAAALSAGDHPAGEIREARVAPAPWSDVLGGSASSSTSVVVPSIPAESTALLGRDAELGDLAELLDDGARLITLTGTGGTGKTRLATRVARRACEALPGVTVVFVSMAPLVDAEQVPGEILRTFGMEGADVDSVVNALSGGEALLVLDNAEHLPGVGQLAGELLGRCPDLRLLATSRAPLGTPGERLYPVEPLDEQTARQLFVERARAVRPGFRLESLDDQAVSEIVSRLACLPLAVELAAARVRVLPPQAMLRRLAGQLDLLAPSRIALPERHQTMRAAIGWSYRLLNAQEQRLFERLSLFVTAASLPSAAAAAELDETETIDGLEGLIDANLVALADDGAEPRYAMLEPIRQFAAEQLETEGQGDSSKRHLLGWYVAHARAAALGDESPWATFSRDEANVLALLRYAADLGEWGAGLELGYWLGEIFHQAAARQEVAEFARCAMPCLAEDPLHEGVALVLAMRGHPADQEALAERAIELLGVVDSRGRGDSTCGIDTGEILAEVFYLRAWNAIALRGRHLTGENAERVDHYLREAERLVDPDSKALVGILGMIAARPSCTNWKPLLERVLPIVDREPTGLWRAYALCQWASVSFLDRDYEQAASLAEQALDNFEHVEHLGIELAVRHTAAMARLLLGQPKEAAALLTQSGEKILGSGLDHADDHIWCVLHVASAIGASQSQPELAAHPTTTRRTPSCR